MTLLAAEAQASREDGSGAVPDLPHASLLSNGYACLAQEGGLTVTIKPQRGKLGLQSQPSISHLADKT